MDDHNSHVFDNTYYYIYQVATGMVLNCGALKDQLCDRKSRADGKYNRHWRFLPVPNKENTYNILNRRANGGWLDADTGGSRARKEYRPDNLYQQWTLEPVPENTGRYWMVQVARNTGISTKMVLDCNGYNASVRHLNTDDNNLYQQWEFIQYMDEHKNWFQISNVMYQNVYLLASKDGTLQTYVQMSYPTELFRLEPAHLKGETNFFIYGRDSNQILSTKSGSNSVRMVNRVEGAGNVWTVKRNTWTGREDTYFFIDTFDNALEAPPSSSTKFGAVQANRVDFFNPDQQWKLNFIDPKSQGVVIPLDLNTKTYSVGIFQWFCDRVHKRSFNPEAIDGVGLIKGVENGNLVGVRLKENISEILNSTPIGFSYYWVYTPKQAIIYVLQNDEKGGNKTYIAHSQLGKGEPVICAGKFKMKENSNLESIMFGLADNSGHYSPKGVKCIPPVLEYLKGLGFNGVDSTQIWVDGDP
ncbi:hypothetical protein DFA_04200 [Cavenderia fasciculata]|uniref:Ricin B lectin domain-containing protein n=1 Tax=Cavenderia fasciculata TaxID=261658 RepID=F4Q1K3_CACFS|nr:uncharacterized protein DFA_04200 [Cavenderia fasciculata]EGG18704.1 hypothetical protein DFA_04200 [Cavenderia fasciculata]|eukprot:XP_004366608.1 hypothetical protein DFA_04200 [Cavenderia fasciculata]